MRDPVIDTIIRDDENRFEVALTNQDRDAVKDLYPQKLDRRDNYRPYQAFMITSQALFSFTALATGIVSLMITVYMLVNADYILIVEWISFTIVFSISLFTVLYNWILPDFKLKRNALKKSTKNE
ncbi:MAG: hypothetical protein ACFFD4_32095 [Candidatus Odinarchaeota archaeon]